MTDWILLEEGTYDVEGAFLVTPDHSALTLEDVLLEVYLNRQQQRRLRGSAMVANLLMVELLEDNDCIDLLLNLGAEFHYLLREPVLRAGKVFAPDVKSLLQFVAQGPSQKLTGEEYRSIRSRLVLIDR